MLTLPEIEQAPVYDLDVAELVEVLIDRLTHTNGLEFCDPKQLALLTTLLND